jgi:hypothetical protein
MSEFIKPGMIISSIGLSNQPAVLSWPSAAANDLIEENGVSHGLAISPQGWTASLSAFGRAIVLLISAASRACLQLAVQASIRKRILRRSRSRQQAKTAKLMQRVHS